MAGRYNKQVQLDSARRHGYQAQVTELEGQKKAAKKAASRKRTTKKSAAKKTTAKKASTNKLDAAK